MGYDARPHSFCRGALIISEDTGGVIRPFVGSFSSLLDAIRIVILPELSKRLSPQAIDVDEGIPEDRS